MIDIELQTFSDGFCYAFSKGKQGYPLFHDKPAWRANLWYMGYFRATGSPIQYQFPDIIFLETH